ncbi:MAG: hypothetical protein LBM21_01550 [Coriobacteriales bacterium]|jgi:hypothetical protein|nr:hypothetical protein [Coriobacteriales bacterium]
MARHHISRAKPVPIRTLLKSYVAIVIVVALFLAFLIAVVIVERFLFG